VFDFVLNVLISFLSNRVFLQAHPLKIPVSVSV